MSLPALRAEPPCRPANRPFYAAIGLILAGERDILGLWACSGGEGAKFWMRSPARAAKD
jgi:transposase-like protein